MQLIMMISLLLLLPIKVKAEGFPVLGRGLYKTSSLGRVYRDIWECHQWYYFPRVWEYMPEASTIEVKWEEDHQGQVRPMAKIYFMLKSLKPKKSELDTAAKEISKLIEQESDIEAKGIRNGYLKEEDTFYYRSCYSMAPQLIPFDLEKSRTMLSNNQAISFEQTDENELFMRLEMNLNLFSPEALNIVQSMNDNTLGKTIKSLVPLEILQVVFDGKIQVSSSMLSQFEQQRIIKERICTTTETCRLKWFHKVCSTDTHCTNIYADVNWLKDLEMSQDFKVEAEMDSEIITDHDDAFALLFQQLLLDNYYSQLSNVIDGVSYAELGTSRKSASHFYQTNLRKTKFTKSFATEDGLQFKNFNPHLFKIKSFMSTPKFKCSKKRAFSHARDYLKNDEVCFEGSKRTPAGIIEASDDEVVEKNVTHIDIKMWGEKPVVFSMKKSHLINSEFYIPNVYKRFDLSGSTVLNSKFTIKPSKNLIFCDLSHGVFRHSDFSGSNLRDCDLRNSDFSDVNFKSVNLAGAKIIKGKTLLKGAKFNDQTHFDFSGLEAVQVYGMTYEP